MIPRNAFLSILTFAALAALARAEEPCPPEPACYEEACVKTCVPTTEVKKKEKVLYSCKSEDYCLTKCSCSLFPWHKCDCGKADCPKCGKPRTRNVLVKRIVNEEECQTKCEVVETKALVPVQQRHPLCFWKRQPAIAVDAAP